MARTSRRSNGSITRSAAVRNRRSTRLGLTSSGTFAFGSGTRGGYAVFSGSNGLSVEVDYMLTGGSSIKQSDLSETIRLTNTGTSSQTYHFFQYSNFNLSGGSRHRAVSQSEHGK